MDGTELLIGTIVLAVGTYAFRLAGLLLRERVKLSPRAERLMVLGAVVLLAALVAVSALTEGHSFAGFARPTGVLVGECWPGARPRSWWSSSRPPRRPRCCASCGVP